MRDLSNASWERKGPSLSLPMPATASDVTVPISSDDLPESSRKTTAVT